MNPPRTGRPPSDNPKDLSVRIRLTADERSKLEYCSEATGKTKAEIIRIGIDKIYQELREQKNN